MASWHNVSGSRASYTYAEIRKDGTTLDSIHKFIGNASFAHFDTWDSGKDRRTYTQFDVSDTFTLPDDSHISSRTAGSDIPSNVFIPGFGDNGARLLGFFGESAYTCKGRTVSDSWTGSGSVSNASTAASCCTDGVDVNCGPRYTAFPNVAENSVTATWYPGTDQVRWDEHLGYEWGTDYNSRPFCLPGRKIGYNRGSGSLTLTALDTAQTHTYNHKYFTRGLTSNSFAVKANKFILKDATVTTEEDLATYIDFPEKNVSCVHNGTTDTVSKDFEISNISSTSAFDQLGQPVVNVTFTVINSYGSSAASSDTEVWTLDDSIVLPTATVTYVLSIPVATDYEPTVEFTRKKSVNYGTGVTLTNLSEYVNIPTKCTYSLEGVEETHEKTTANEIVAVSTDVNALFQTVVIISMRKYKSDADTGEITTEPSTIYKDFSVTIGTKYPINTFVQHEIPNIGEIEFDSPGDMATVGSAAVHDLSPLDDAHAIYLTPAVFTTECTGHQLKLTSFGQSNSNFSELGNLPYDGGTVIGEFKTGSEVTLSLDLGTAYYFDTFNNAWTVKANEIVQNIVKAKVTPKYKCFPVAYAPIIEADYTPAVADAIKIGANNWTKMTGSVAGTVEAAATLGLSFNYSLVETQLLFDVPLPDDLPNSLTRNINTELTRAIEVVTNEGKGSKNNLIRIYAHPLVYYNLGSPVESTVSHATDTDFSILLSLLNDGVDVDEQYTVAEVQPMVGTYLRFDVGKSVDNFFFKGVSSSSKLLRYSDYDSLTNTTASADIAEFVFGDTMGYKLTFDVQDENGLVTEHSYTYDEYTELFNEILEAGPLSDFVSGGYVQVPNINTYGQFVIENMGTDSQTIEKLLPMVAQANLKCEVLTENFDLQNVIPLPTQHKFPKKRAEQYVGMTPEQWHEAVGNPGALQIPLYFEYYISPTRKTERVPFSDLLVRDLVRPQTKFSIDWGDATHETIVFQVNICDHFEINARGTEDEEEDTTKRVYSNHTYVYEVIPEELVEGGEVLEWNNAMYPPYGVQDATNTNAIEHITDNQKIQAYLNSLLAKSRITNFNETLHQLNKAGVVRMVLVRNCVQNLGGGNYGLSASDQAKCIGVLTDAPNLQKAMLGEARSNPAGYHLNNLNWFTMDPQAAGFSWDSFNRMAVGIIEAVQDPNYPHHTYVLFNAV